MLTHCRYTQRILRKHTHTSETISCKKNIEISISNGSSIKKHLNYIEELLAQQLKNTRELLAHIWSRMAHITILQGQTNNYVQRSKFVRG